MFTRAVLVWAVLVWPMFFRAVFFRVMFVRTMRFGVVFFRTPVSACLCEPR